MSPSTVARLAVVVAIVAVSASVMHRLDEAQEYERPTQVAVSERVSPAPWELVSVGAEIEYVLGRGATCAEAQIDGAGGHREWPLGVKEAKCVLR